MTRLIHPDQRVLAATIVVGAVAVLLPFVVSLTPEKAIAAHLMGLMIAAIAAKSIWRPGDGDGLLLSGAGALAVIVPVFAWQMPAGGAWALPVIGAFAFAAGLRHSSMPAGTRHDAPETGAAAAER
ncbi:hypothetical protein [Histidinibacterium aquaticum]|uniref:SPW repeat-containing protein n=1 Tax=Histidinibacterium aquaticum TaxID=2613962 RepID=A0A5J5GCV5_9RHOB|nr:hypothetical protein [Histidinibacterium aquaticum]KAA9005760.1 hypothetical protein F3S47_17850 [Histidinibacterium aquaticum]